jgi:hypothetical protein
MDAKSIMVYVSAGKILEVLLVGSALWLWRKIRKEKKEGEKLDKNGILLSSGENYNVKV